ncbi:unnamed protein product [Pleuronectes platessa]|uniref:Uncharacterized protein n=1 Tax=Pleuronectes platessa TaxID=8262 RepID=A0A9N7U3A8_PLEPL|nr:unnamed protein product [Pleuronectes platessa]
MVPWLLLGCGPMDSPYCCSCSRFGLGLIQEGGWEKGSPALDSGVQGPGLDQSTDGPSLLSLLSLEKDGVSVVFGSEARGCDGTRWVLWLRVQDSGSPRPEPPSLPLQVNPLWVSSKPDRDPCPPPGEGGRVVVPVRQQQGVDRPV